ncbi:hypothetical protein ARMGADRAFT_186525 [Armillaria gallica]|uniref:BZIP domain-containing protein n=1 Tax=Armillaria gallica TaxID=47427 RepID=A0A2H3DD94_ARMGA|nr:hypothetical protein ARMGADRAFT_186525 [Armillaria gallica]
MTRGRKKDPTIPITRSLAQQRDYRARRAQYIADLEKKCHLLEMENYDLRQELRYLSVPSPYVVSRRTRVANIRIRPISSDRHRAVQNCNRSLRRGAETPTRKYTFPPFLFNPFSGAVFSNKLTYYR